MFNRDKATTVFYISSIIVGIIDAIAIIAFVILFTLIAVGIVLSTKLFIILAIILGVLNVLEIIFVPIYLKCRKD